jgi:probable HAF family extracellular repeat protein
VKILDLSVNRRAGGTVMRKRQLLFALAAILLVFNSSVNAYRALIDLGTLGSNKSYAHSINDNGQIVGYSLDSSGHERACLFDSAGNWQNNKDLGSFPGQRSRATSINNSGQIVGYFYNSSGSEQACLFNSASPANNKYLGTLGGNYSMAQFINNNGQIVGTSQLAPTGGGTPSYHACLFDPTGAGANIDLSISPSISNAAYSISDNGKVVGLTYYLLSPFSHAYLFDSTGGGANKDLGTIGDSSSMAFSINDIGQIVGAANGRACLFDPSGGGVNIDLGSIAGWTSSSASFINDAGQIVGSVSKRNSPSPLPVYRACLFDSTGYGNNTDLNQLIDPALASVWTLEHAYCINNNGWIVGSMYNAAGDTHAFLLTLEPATLLLLTLGGLALRKRKV